MGKKLDSQFCVDFYTCEREFMATNLALDDLLIEEARLIGNHKTKRQAVTAALEEYVRWRRQLRILEPAEGIAFDAGAEAGTVERGDGV